MNKTEFEEKLDSFLKNVREKSEAQFEYNLKVNIPQKIIEEKDCVQHALDIGIVSAISQMNSWDINKAIEFSANLLEDSNCHEECKVLREFLE